MDDLHRVDIAQTGEKKTPKLLTLLLFSGLMIKRGVLFQIPLNFKRPSKHCQYQINIPLVFFGSLFLDSCGPLPDLFLVIFNCKDKFIN